MYEALTWISLIVGIISIVIAVFAIILSSKSEKSIVESVNTVKEMMTQFQGERKTFETSMQYFLSEMDKKTERIEEISRQTKDSVNDSVKRVFESQFPNQDESFRNSIMASLMSNPDSLAKLATSLPDLQKAVDGLNKK